MPMADHQHDSTEPLRDPRDPELDATAIFDDKSTEELADTQAPDRLLSGTCELDDTNASTARVWLP